MIEINKIYNEDCLRTMNNMEDNFLDLTITSPPYSDLRDYKKYDWNFESVAKELFRVTKQGGVLIWVIGDKTKNGTEELVPYKQCLFLNSVGFNVWDTMIYAKNNCPFPANVRYNQQFEFMFVFSKGNIKTFNPIKESKSEKAIEKIKKGNISFKSKSFRNKDGSITRADSDIRMLNRIEISGKKLEKTKSNVWFYNSGYMVSSKDKFSFEHPATFPEKLAEDHILSWSNINDIVYDPFCGSGTTVKMAKLNGRNFIGSEISNEYCDIIRKRIQ